MGKGPWRERGTQQSPALPEFLASPHGGKKQSWISQFQQTPRGEETKPQADSQNQGPRHMAPGKPPQPFPLREASATAEHE